VSLKVDIDPHSGFCFGVTKAIEAADALLGKGEKVYCVGEIVHNQAESNRLELKGMKTIELNQIQDINSGTILFRAHGESPLSYTLVKDQNLSLKDATCPVVLKLQKRIKAAWLHQKQIDGQIAIYGKPGHPELIGLAGQTNDEAVLISAVKDLTQLNFSRPIELFSQTTMSPEEFEEIVAIIKSNADNPKHVLHHNTTCRQVTGRVPRIKQFAKDYDLILFVSGKNSSNGKVLYNACQSVNPKSYFITKPEEVERHWFTSSDVKVGICGATSTPLWLMEAVKDTILKL